MIDRLASSQFRHVGCGRVVPGDGDDHETRDSLRTDPSAIPPGADAGGDIPVIIVEQWNSSGFPDWKPTKVMAIAILDDRETRHRFEDKLVTQLRGRDIVAATSYPLVPDLLAPGSREEVLKKVDEQKIDGAITFRLVPLGEKDEAAWSGDWKQQVEESGTLRSLVQASLPLAKTDSKLYGVEVTLWGGQPAERVWAGRSGAHKLKDLREGATGFIQDVIKVLKDLHRI